MLFNIHCLFLQIVPRLDNNNEHCITITKTLQFKCWKFLCTAAVNYDIIQFLLLAHNVLPFRANINILLWFSPLWTFNLYISTFQHSLHEIIDRWWLLSWKNPDVKLKGTLIVLWFLWSVCRSQLPVQSVPITTDVVSSNLDQDEVYNIIW